MSQQLPILGGDSHTRVCGLQLVRGWYLWGRDWRAPRWVVCDHRRLTSRRENRCTNYFLVMSPPHSFRKGTNVAQKDVELGHENGHFPPIPQICSKWGLVKESEWGTRDLDGFKICVTHNEVRQVNSWAPDWRGIWSWRQFQWGDSFTSRFLLDNKNFKRKNN